MEWIWQRQWLCWEIVCSQLIFCTCEKMSKLGIGIKTYGYTISCIKLHTQRTLFKHAKIIPFHGWPVCRSWTFLATQKGIHRINVTTWYITCCGMYVCMKESKWSMYMYLCIYTGTYAFWMTPLICKVLCDKSSLVCNEVRKPKSHTMKYSGLVS